MWPKDVGGEFHRKVRTLAGNFQLIQVAPWTLSLQNRVLFQLVSHKLMRLVAPYLLVLLQVSTLALSQGSPIYAALAAFQLFSLAIAVAALRFRIPGLHRIAAPASALLMLNAAAVVGFYKFLFTRGPLWKIWNAKESSRTVLPEPAAVFPVIDVGKGLYREAPQRDEAEEPAAIL